MSRILLPHGIRPQPSLFHLNPACRLQIIRLPLDASATVTEHRPILGQVRRRVVHAILGRDLELHGMVSLPEARDAGARGRVLRSHERLARRDVEAVDRAVH